MTFALCLISFVAGFGACYALIHWATDDHPFEPLGHDIGEQDDV